MPKRPVDLELVRGEVERAAQHYYHTTQQSGIDNRTKRFVVERCMEHVAPGTVLELGYIDGLWTDALLARGCRVDIVEGATAHVAHAGERYREDSRVRVHHSLFQEYTPDRSYETIVAADVIRYLADPGEFLARARGWLVESGTLIATVPNSRSLHRRIGALLNVQDTPQGFNQRDREVGNIRGYDRYEFRRLLLDAGYAVHELRGCFLKPLSSAQMEDWSEELLSALAEMGNELEDYCWFIYAVCTRSKHENGI